MEKRRFSIIVGLLLIAGALSWGVDQAQAKYYANSPIIPKFVEPLPAIPVATTATLPPGVPNDGDYYEIDAVQTTHQFSSSLPAGKVRGYMQHGGTYSYLGPMIVATRNRPVRLKFTNSFPANGKLFLPVDTNLMGAGMGPDGVSPYSQNRTTLHLHGGVTPWISDGTPHQWITPAGETTPYLKGASQRNVPDMFGGNPPAGSETIYYSNQQSGRLMFYHDHAFGITRLHVYAGMAAAYLIHDAAEDALITAGTIPTGGTIPQGTTLGVPLVIQDKTFVGANTAADDPNWATVAATWGGSAFGDLWFPHVYEFNQSASFASGGGVNPQGRWDYGPYVLPPGTIADTASGFGNSMGMTLPAAIGDVRDPSCVPEAFMDTMVVNGKAYPTLTVAPQAYRFRILNACNDRTLNLQLYYADNSGPFPAPTSLIAPLPAGYASNITARSPAGTEVSMVKADATVYTIPAASVQFGNPYQMESGVLTPLFYPIGGQPTVAVPFDGRVGGVPDPRQTGPQMIQIGNEGGLLPAPIVLANTCVDYIYDRKQITYGDVRNYALQTPNPSNPTQTLNYPHPGYNLQLGPAERADVIIDFSSVPSGSKLILFNDGPAPQPGFDPRYDYYTGDPDYSNSLTGLGMGGALSTQVGFGPNTRTIMQITVTGTAGTAYNLTTLQAALPTYFAANQPPLLVAPGNYSPVTNITAITGANGHDIPIFNKSIAEDFDPIWGRMNAELGTEQTSTNSQGQQTFGFHFADPATEKINVFNNPIFPGGSIKTPVPTTSTFGTQIWKITHNGVDTHAIHFHLFNVQVINRADWAGVIKPPDPNEMGWKETVRLNPLEDIFVALQPKLPTLPFSVPSSMRPLDPTMPVGMTNAMFWNKLPAGGVLPNFPFTNPGPGNVTVVNNLTDFFNEYVWHCHLLGHEENDMMRAISVMRPEPTMGVLYLLLLN